MSFIAESCRLGAHGASAVGERARQKIHYDFSTSADMHFY